MWFKKPVGDLRGRLGKSPVLYTAGMVAEIVREVSPHKERCRIYKKFMQLSLMERLRHER